MHPMTLLTLIFKKVEELFVMLKKGIFWSSIFHTYHYISSVFDNLSIPKHHIVEKLRL